MKLQCTNTEKGDLLIMLNGEMDAFGCTKIRDELEKLVDTKNTNMILDLTEVNFIDSSGIGAIVFLYKRIKAQDRTLMMIGVQGQPKELMELLRIETAIPISTKPVTEFHDMNNIKNAC